MQLNTVEELIEDIRAGKPVILMDDEERENEGDMLIAADKVTPEIINFMTREARGLLCLTLTGERCDQLKLRQMTEKNANTSGFGTPFTVSIEAAEGVTTGISAFDRAVTIKTAVNPSAGADDLVHPGHIFPLRAQSAGVLARAGHTEAGCDLTRLAGLTPAAAIIEIMAEDGTMARRPQLEAFAQKHDLKIGTVKDLIHYRIQQEQMVTQKNRQKLQTQFGEFDLTVYDDIITGQTHMALSMGNLLPDDRILTGIHTGDTLNDMLAVTSRPYTRQVLQEIAQTGSGMLVMLDIDGYQKPEQIIGALNRKSIKTHDDLALRTCQRVASVTGIIRDMGVKKLHLIAGSVSDEMLNGIKQHIADII
ncbi:Riboflavin biosynthesis protein RibBA [invertebrate metagenome]|uniref:Riboflavin biosynthesis protein RibBA n=1 Tax=invertebrate metagenome TaxID=1711999 RepID=A0A2H9T891_9ZZZZ